ncbi:hypothetical protein P7K49_031362 [Saguinus oedipus]|uniref:Uncharacterized protein n=1 Tax=Saguinus oedipus TaxID=9490 RepID=A0ABQ9TZ64_SAGOE|nr:hypothetical protein P7K49_031362 [Saguinus oedipus]
MSSHLVPTAASNPTPSSDDAPLYEGTPRDQRSAHLEAVTTGAPARFQWQSYHVPQTVPRDQGPAHLPPTAASNPAPSSGGDIACAYLSQGQRTGLLSTYHLC